MASTGSDSRIFIVGFGRSGTTLLRTIISRHSRMAITPETHFLKRAEAAGGPDGGPADFERFWSALTQWVRFRDLGIDAGETRALIERSGDFSFRSIFDAMLDAYGRRLATPRVGEKTPSHSRYLGTLLRWFPDARVLVMERDPRAAIASFLETPWVREKIHEPSLRKGLTTGDPVNAIADLAAEWDALYARQFARWEDDRRFRRVPYEALVSEPEREVRAICAFLGEEFEHGMLGSGEVPDPSGAIPDEKMEVWRRRHEERSKQPVSADSLDKWRDRLSPAQIALIEARCTSGMARCGYAPEAAPPSRLMSNAIGTVISNTARLEQRARRAVAEVITGSASGNEQA